MSNLDFTKAISTPDGVITNMSEKPEKNPHPVYGTEAFAARIEFDLKGRQREMFVELLNRQSKYTEMHRSTRSNIDQLKLFGGEYSTTSFNKPAASGPIEMETLLTCIDAKQDNRVLTTLQRLVAAQQRPQYSRLLLAPRESWKGERLIKLTNEEVIYDHSAISEQLLESIWLGKIPGREAIKPFMNKQKRPDILTPQQFLISEVEAMTPGDITSQYFWTICRRLRDVNGQKVEVRHGDAVVFDPRRSIGLRQVEVMNCDNTSIITHGLQIKVNMYDTNFHESQIDQMSGV